MSSDISKEQFESRWNSHVSDLDGLGWNLAESDRERLFEMTDELQEMVARAAENRERRRD